MKLPAKIVHLSSPFVDEKSFPTKTCNPLNVEFPGVVEKESAGTNTLPSTIAPNVFAPVCVMGGNWSSGSLFSQLKKVIAKNNNVVFKNNCFMIIGFWILWLKIRESENFRSPEFLVFKNSGLICEILDSFVRK